MHVQPYNYRDFPNINPVHDSMRFTMELETYGCMPLLLNVANLVFLSVSKAHAHRSVIWQLVTFLSVAMQTKSCKFVFEPSLRNSQLSQNYAQKFPT